MVENIIREIIIINLSEYLGEENIQFYPSNRIIKYVISFKEIEIEICYEFVDNFYRIKIENKKNNSLQNVLFLTKSKKYHKELQKELKKNKLSSKLFENHILYFIKTLKRSLNKDNNKLDLFNGIYDQTLKFDGIFI